jgi:hypothetical protein
MSGRTIGAYITRTSPSLVFMYPIVEQAHVPDLTGLFITWEMNTSCASCHRHSTDACQAARHTTALFQVGHGQVVREQDTPVTPSCRSEANGSCCQGCNLLLLCSSANRHGSGGVVRCLVGSPAAASQPRVSATPSPLLRRAAGDWHRVCTRLTLVCSVSSTCPATDVEPELVFLIPATSLVTPRFFLLVVETCRSELLSLKLLCANLLHRQNVMTQATAAGSDHVMLLPVPLFT